MQQDQQTTTVLTALQQLAIALAAIPGRKNLVWISDAFPVTLYPDQDNRTQVLGFHGHELPQVFNDTANLLTASRIALYPVSASGLMVDHTGDADTGNRDMAANPSQQASAARATMAAMEQLAKNTGGHAIYTSNDLAGALTREVRNGAQYYTIAYTPKNQNMDGKFRRIEVKLIDAKYRLTYRDGYYATPEPIKVSETSSDPLAPFLAEGLPEATLVVYRIRLTVEAQPTGGTPRAGGNAKVPMPITRYHVDFLIPIESLAFNVSMTGTHDAKIRVAMVAYGQDGKPANWTGGEMKLSLSDASFTRAQRTGIEAPMVIDLPQSDLSLVTGIWDTESHRAGTLRIPISSKTGVVAQ
jgi:hypothetical protein